MSGNKKENLFANLGHLAARTAAADTAPVDTMTIEPALHPVTSKPATKPKAVTAKKQSEPAIGKRHNPEYCQANAYVPKSIRKAVDRELLDIDGLDFSTLVSDLLAKWLKSRGVSA